jgi:hypothetical protein
VSIEVSRLQSSDLAGYCDLISRIPLATIHGSLEWKAFTEEALGDAKPLYLVARNRDRLVGALPAYEQVGPRGIVINSLPYFGSHGDLLIDPHEERGPVARALLAAVDDYRRSIDAISVNIVGQLFRADDRELLDAWWISKVDDRIGQLSRLPRETARNDLLDAVLAKCTPKSRNLVRKGLKGRFVIGRSDSEADWKALHCHHVNGMTRIGGNAKPWGHLIALRRAFSAADTCRLYTAHIDGTFAGGLLMLVWGQWAEYFMPVAVEEQRSNQVVSALIARVMVELAAEGVSLWNWGGTWRNQTGVYRFKKGWGSSDLTYGYYGYSRREAFAGASSATLREDYPFFYLFPF